MSQMNFANDPPMGHLEERDSCPRADHEPDRLTNTHKLCLGLLGALLVNCLWVLKQYQVGAFNRSGTGDLDLVVATAFLLIALIVSALAGLMAKDSREVMSWRVIVQGVTLPSFIIGVAATHLPADVAFQNKNDAPPALRHDAGGYFGATSWVFREAIAQQRPTVKPLPPPSTVDKLVQGLKVYLGRYPDNWWVEAGRFPDGHQAAKLAEELRDKGFTPQVYTLPAEGQGNALSRYVVILGSSVSPMQARELQDQARQKGVSTKVWQY